MIAADPLVVDLGGDNYLRLLDLLGGLYPVAGGERGLLLVVYRGLKLLKAVDLGAGRAVEVDWRGSARLDLLARESGYRTVLALEETAPARICGHAQRLLHHGDDYLLQWLAFLKGLTLEWRRTVFVHPPGPRAVFLPSPRFLRLLLRLLVPPDTLALFAVTQGGRAWASLVAGFPGGEFGLLTSLENVEMEDCEMSCEQLHAASEALESKHGGTVRAVVVEREALQRIRRSGFRVRRLLWEINSGGLRLARVPLRWLLIPPAAAFVLRRARAGPSAHRPPVADRA